MKTLTKSEALKAISKAYSRPPMNTTSEKSQHTPGPWKLDATNIVAENGKTVIDKGSILWNYGEGQSNAHLIAAAPDLLQACKCAVSKLSTLEPYPSTLVQMLDKAIHKATTL